ncbi:hypothetical protein C8A03DRAFT_17937 [Achaetomium macrosporum]|uniref:DUF7730 domain-containing protein n=1 Tax=Achaetomium macrosporum TaxID=79813 RepID=A0AAN7H517_9PEZI|nr:hypothetical protein C8A03DRAFT_17937 [Achaetomium macrosporum]
MLDRADVANNATSRIDEAACSSTEQHREQLASPIFGKLPPELRALIFTELFGRRRVHLEFMPHPTRADKVGNRRRWRHGVCEDELDSPFVRVTARSHYCLTSARRRVLDISMIFTCWQALTEGIPVLYQSNVFLIVNTGGRRRPVDDIRSLQAKIPKHWPLVRSLEIKWEVAAFDRNQASMVPHLWGREAYESLWDALAEMPTLAHLRIAVLMPRFCSRSEPNTSCDELRDIYLTPILRLKGLRSCELIMPKSYRPVPGGEEWESFMARSGRGQYHISWIEDSGLVPSEPALAGISRALIALT